MFFLNGLGSFPSSYVFALICDFIRDNYDESNMRYRTTIRVTMFYNFFGLLLIILAGIVRFRIKGDLGSEPKEEFIEKNKDENKVDEENKEEKIDDNQYKEENQNDNENKNESLNDDDNENKEENKEESINDDENKDENKQEIEEENTQKNEEENNEEL